MPGSVRPRTDTQGVDRPSAWNGTRCDFGAVVEVLESVFADAWFVQLREILPSG